VRGCASTSHVARVLGFDREEVVARVVMWWCVGIYVTPSPPLVFIEHAIRLSSYGPIRNQIRLGSNIIRVLIQIIMIAS
jgi:hypothetical protein